MAGRGGAREMGRGGGGPEAAAAGPVFRVRRVAFRGREAPVVMQNENGPCPLLGVVNALLLRGALALRGSEATDVQLEALLALVAGRLLDANARATGEGADHAENQRKNVADAIALLPKLATGVDVNPIFRSPQAFEFTDEIAIFDMLDLGVVHGWVVDPTWAGAEEVAPMSYNRLMERIIELRSAEVDVRAGGADEGADRVKGDSPGEETDGVGGEGAGTATLGVLEEFLGSSPSQLTEYGLEKLHGALKPNELAVFFRNNHFSTILKHEGEIYTLVTDQGYIAEPRAVWERLSNIDGDTQYVNENFQVAATSLAQFAGEVGTWSDDAAAQLMSKAASLNERMNGPSGERAGSALLGGSNPRPGGSKAGSGTAGGSAPLTGGGLGHNHGPDADADFALALQLQEQYKEEERRMAAQHARQAQEAADRDAGRAEAARRAQEVERSSASQRRKRDDKCAIM